MMQQRNRNWKNGLSMIIGGQRPTARTGANTLGQIVADIVTLKFRRTHSKSSPIVQRVTPPGSYCKFTPMSLFHSRRGIPAEVAIVKLIQPAAYVIQRTRHFCENRAVGCLRCISNNITVKPY